MTRRLAAAGVGAVLIAVAVVAFLLGDHPVVAGTNTVSPAYAVGALYSHQPQCQAASRVPAKASHVQVAVAIIDGKPGKLRVAIRPSPKSGQPTVGQAPVSHGELIIRLHRQTRALRRASLCMTYLGPGSINLFGERKRIPPGAPFANGVDGKQGLASVIFLRRGLESWASRGGVIHQRFAASQAGSFGRWSFWVAFLAALTAAGVAIWWIAIRPDSDDSAD